MTTNYTIQLNQSNDEVIQLTFTEADTGDPYVLDASVYVEFFIKTTSATPDTDPSTVVLSTETGTIVVTDGNGGVCEATIPALDLGSSGPFWWRADVVGTGGAPRKTGGCGNLNISPM